MDSIDNNVMQDAAEKVIHAMQDRPGAIIHTVTVTLNGQHGGADVIIDGYTAFDSDHISIDAFSTTEVIK